MKVNIDGHIATQQQLSLDNRGFKYGDALFETIKVSNHRIVFWEDHYFRLMASMRILRMAIPTNFTMEYLEQRILDTLQDNDIKKGNARIRLSVFRQDGGRYTPDTCEVSFIIEAISIQETHYPKSKETYIADVFKDYFVSNSLLDTLKTNNRIFNVVGSIFAQENQLDNCILINHQKNVVEALHGNLFLIKGKEIVTPPLSDGCINGIIRKNIIQEITKHTDYQMKELSISPFEIQHFDGVFITNSIIGIQEVSQYKKKVFGNEYLEDIKTLLHNTAFIASAY